VVWLGGFELAITFSGLSKKTTLACPSEYTSPGFEIITLVLQSSPPLYKKVRKWHNNTPKPEVLSCL
jgi:hypothetical protein